MNRGFLLVLVPALAWLDGMCPAQEAPRPEPSFALIISGPQQDAKVGSPIALRVTLTNVSDHDISDSVSPSSESKSRVARSVDLRVYDGDGKPVPETRHGRRVHAGDADQSTGVLTVVSVPVKPGKGFHEDADLTEEFDLRKPGKYTAQAERFDPYSKGLVRSNIIEIRIVQ